MKINSVNPLPKNAGDIMNGGVYHQAVRCGKPTCRCASGDPHEGYFYFIRRVDGRLRKTYVPRHQVEQLRALIESFRLDRKQQRDARLGSSRLLSEFTSNLRGYDPIIKQLAGGLETT